MKIGNLMAVILLAGVTAHGQIIIADNYNVAGSGSGFGLGSGVNSGINPPATRLTGSAAANLRYISTENKATTAFTISSSKLRVTPAPSPGRFTFSADGTVPFNFASALGSTTATPQNPIVYDITISMASSTPGTERFSFAIGTAEGDATTWDFGIQIYRTGSSDNFYTIGKRIDIAASGLAGDLNKYITNSAPGTHGTEIDFLMRVTDAGNEPTTYNSRVQLSMDGGFTWFYDTATDSDLANGWRLNGAGRYIMWDVAPNAGNVTYDNFSLRSIPISATSVSPSDNAQNLGPTPSLKVAVSNTVPGNLMVTYFGREAPTPRPSSDFCIAVLPDTQNYARESSGSGNATKEMWFSQTEWIITNRVQQNIAYVATLGDCVQTATSHTQWRHATNAYYRLENKARTLLEDGIPYGVTVGNHDQSPAGDEDGETTYYNQYFGIAHFQGKAYYGGNYASNNDSWYTKFSAGGMDFLVFSFEYGRYGSGILDWAHSVMNAHPNHRVIVLTHHAGSDSTPSNHSGQGAAIYNSLRTNPNFFLMLGGHVFNGSGEGEGRRTNTFNGNTVYTLVSDYQGRFNGGNGLMRLMYFSPSNNIISVKTYSPWIGSFETDSNSQFTLPYNMEPNGTPSPGTPYVALGTNMNVVAGTQSTFTWSGIQANKTYEWYVKVTDDLGNSISTMPRKFSTTNNTAPIVSNRLLTISGDQPTQITLTAFDGNGDTLIFQTNSRPLRGLNTNFDPDAGTVTYLPAHNYRGLDRFTYSATDGFASSVVANFDLNIIAPADTNANELPDIWEEKYGINNPESDDDGDGQNNLAEYLANTNPTNAASLLQIVGAIRNTSGNFEITWSSIGGTRYRVQYSDGDLTNGFTDVIRFVDTEMDPGPHGTTSTQFFVDDFTLTTTNNGNRFYRVKVAP